MALQCGTGGSDQIARQIAELTEPLPPRFLEFMPLYRPATFAGIANANLDKRPFHVIYVGRVEANKGIFDYLAMARLICKQTDDIEFHVCGVGSALPELQMCLAEEPLSGRFHIHGYCDREQLTRMYNRAHVVVVPTRSDCGEGFNQVVIEAVLAGRPVVTSAMCPALAYVREAAVEVAPDDIPGYADAVLSLSRDAELFQSKQYACKAAKTRFYDPNNSWGAMVRQVAQTERGINQVSVRIRSV